MGLTEGYIPAFTDEVDMHYVFYTIYQAKPEIMKTKQADLQQYSNR